MSRKIEWNIWRHLKLEPIPVLEQGGCGKVIRDDERGGSSLQVVALTAAPLARSSHLPSTLITLDHYRKVTLLIITIIPTHTSSKPSYCQDCNHAPSDRERHRRGYCPLSPLSNTPEQSRLNDGGNGDNVDCATESFLGPHR